MPVLPTPTLRYHGNIMLGISPVCLRLFFKVPRFEKKLLFSGRHLVFVSGRTIL